MIVYFINDFLFKIDVIVSKGYYYFNAKIVYI